MYGTKSPMKKNDFTFHFITFKSLQLYEPPTKGSRSKGEQLISVQIRVVVNLCKYKHKNIYFQR